MSQFKKYLEIVQEDNYNEGLGDFVTKIKNKITGNKPKPKLESKLKPTTESIEKIEKLYKTTQKNVKTYLEKSGVYPEYGGTHGDSTRYNELKEILNKNYDKSINFNAPGSYSTTDNPIKLTLKIPKLILDIVSVNSIENFARGCGLEWTQENMAMLDSILNEINKSHAIGWLKTIWKYRKDGKIGQDD
jgi:hypothetical protein